ncbi:MAG TPA: hypothetical protein VKQ52_10800 [Puia sp.]|nr:hypothetical protein [Puia sp.]
MKLNPAVALLVVLAACNSAPSAPATDASKPAVDSAAMKAIRSPYDIRYSSKFEMDDPKNAETVLALWKAYDNGDLNVGKDMIADSIALYLANGAAIHTSRDSATASVQAVRNSFKAVEDRVDAVMAIKSTDRNEHWVLIWGTEVDTHKDGKIDSTQLQETWRFNSSGKADLLYQFARPPLPPAPKKK